MISWKLLKELEKFVQLVSKYLDFAHVKSTVKLKIVLEKRLKEILENTDKLHFTA